MKYFMLLLLLISNNLYSKLQAQETEKHQETFAKFQITDGTVNGKDVTPTLINENAYLVIYRIVETNDLYMANFWQTSKSQSFGSIYAIEEKHIEADDENYEADLFYFQWSYINTYDSKKGTAKVELMKIYKPQGVYFKMTIVPENLDVLVYKGFMSGSLDLKVYERKN